MATPDRRTKMISLRLSELEYDILKTRYHEYGARNVSELARIALRRIIAGADAQQGALAEQIAELDGRLHAVESQLRISRALFRPAAARVSGSEPQ